MQISAERQLVQVDDVPACLHGGGEMGARIRAHDWAATPLGAPATWPEALRTALSICLTTPLVAAVHWGPELRILYNDAYAPALGDKHPWALGRPFRKVWAEIWDVLGPQIDGVLATGIGFSTERQQLRMRRHGRDEETWWIYSFAPVCGKDGAVDGIFVTALETTGDEVAQRESAAELEGAQEALRQSQKMEAIGQLTGGVAHDFNNLLTVIRGSVDLLRRPDLTPERRDRYIDAIGDTADRAANLTRQLLAFARRQALMPVLFDLGASIDEVATMVRTLAGSRIQVELKPPRVPLFVLADRSQLDTAIVNLAINARDAMDGEGRLTIAVGAVSNLPARRAHEQLAGDFVAIAVTDEGVGIAEDDIGRVFEPFFTTKAAGHGTGLGLSQVIGFAKQSGGDVTVESRLGEGTTFTLYLPRADAEGRIADDLPAEVRGDGTGVCVLLVEDNPDVGDFAVSALDELGYDSVLARDGEQAIAELEHDCARFHILFTDVVMPGIGGLELAQHVRQHYPALPIILTSGYSHVLAENGAHGFELLHKPYSIDQLSRVLRKAIAWHERSGEAGAG